MQFLHIRFGLTFQCHKDVGLIFQLVFCLAVFEVLRAVEISFQEKSVRDLQQE